MSCAAAVQFKLDVGRSGSLLKASYAHSREELPLPLTAHPAMAINYFEASSAGQLWLCLLVTFNRSGSVAETQCVMPVLVSRRTSWRSPTHTRSFEFKPKRCLALPTQPSVPPTRSLPPSPASRALMLILPPRLARRHARRSTR